MAYAIIKTGGKQYRVAEGQTVDIDKLEAEVGSTAIFSDVIFVGEGSEIKAGDVVLGTMGSSAGRHGLAMLRVDRLEEAKAAGVAPIASSTTLEIQLW